jgi:hypothetical protein
MMTAHLQATDFTFWRRHGSRSLLSAVAALVVIAAGPVNQLDSEFAVSLIHHFR